jgi:hypothetical protein
MILTTTRHGRSARDTRYLLAHLSGEDRQRSRVIEIAAPAASAADALSYMEALRDGSRATVAFHHLSLNPSELLTDEQRDETVRRTLTILGAEDHAHVVWEHSEKKRRGRDADTHWHMVVSHVGPDGRALDDGRSFVRLEAAARSLEADFGHDMTPSRRPEAVALELERMGRADVAQRVRGEVPPEPPQSAMSSRQRARAERHGISLPDMREAVREAWEASDSPAALRAALAEHGLAVARGDKDGVWLVTGPDGEMLGALDRLARQKRREVAVQMRQESRHDHEAPARDAGPQGDLRRGQARPGDCREPDPTARAPGAAGRGRGRAAGRDQRNPVGDPRRAGPDARVDRGTIPDARRWTRGQQAVAVRQLATAGRQAMRKRCRTRHDDLADVRAAIRSAQGRTGLSETLDDLARRAREIAASWTAALYRIDPDAAVRDRLRLANERADAARVKEQRRAPDEPERAPQPRM